MSADLKGAKTDRCFDFPASDHELVVLVPMPVAAYCYLFEALLWVAVQRIPLAVWNEDADRRINTEDMDSIEPQLEFEPVSDEECERVGLPVNPEHALFINGDYHCRPEHLERITLLDASLAEQEEFQAQLEAARRHYEAVDAWDKIFEEFLDLPKSRLFVALREGKILCAGKPIPLDAFSSFPESLKQDQWQQWVNEPWQQIPASNWLSGGIDWAGCKASGTKEAFALIVVSTEQLMAAFPPTREPAGAAVKIGDTYQIEDQPTVARTGSRGRPALDWDAFHVEMAKRVVAGDLPQKQEALIADMQAWCAGVWKRPVGRSTILPKVKPYYSAFVRLSKNGQ